MSYEVNDKAGPRSSQALPAQAPHKSSVGHRGGDGCVQGMRTSYRLWWVITLLCYEQPRPSYGAGVWGSP